MKKKFPRTAKDIKIGVALAELRRAHAIIVLLAFSLAAVLALASTAPIQFDGGLSLVVVFLLAVVGCVSLAITLLLYRIKK